MNLEQYDMIRSMSSEIRAYAPDARVLTTYYTGEPVIWINNYAVIVTNLMLLLIHFWFHILFSNGFLLGPSGAELAANNFEAFVKVPGILRPHTQIFCTRYFLSFFLFSFLCVCVCV